MSLRKYASDVSKPRFKIIIQEYKAKIKNLQYYFHSFKNPIDTNTDQVNIIIIQLLILANYLIIRFILNIDFI